MTWSVAVSSAESGQRTDSNVNPKWQFPHSTSFSVSCQESSYYTSILSAAMWYWDFLGPYWLPFRAGLQLPGSWQYEVKAPPPSDAYSYNLNLSRLSFPLPPLEQSDIEPLLFYHIIDSDRPLPSTCRGQKIYQPGSLSCWAWLAMSTCAGSSVTAVCTKKKHFIHTRLEKTMRKWRPNMPMRFRDICFPLNFLSRRGRLWSLLFSGLSFCLNI